MPEILDENNEVLKNWAAKKHPKWLAINWMMMVPKSLHGIWLEISKHLGSWHAFLIFRATKIMMFFSLPVNHQGWTAWFFTGPQTSNNFKASHLFIVIASIAKGLGNGWTCHGHDLDIKKTNLMAIHVFFAWEKNAVLGSKLPLFPYNRG